MLQADKLGKPEQLTNFMTSIYSSTMQIDALFASPALSSVNAVDNSNDDLNNQPKASTSTVVNISSEGREKLALEESELGEKLAKQIQPDSAEDIENNDSERATKLLDKLIEETQDKIKDAQQELRALKTKNTEEAKQEQKMLESQITSLNVILIGLFGKKLESLEQ